MNRRGFTVMELVMGLAAAAVVALVSAALFKAGLKTYWYVSNQNDALKSAAYAFEGNGKYTGMVKLARASASVGSLSSTTALLVSSASFTTAYSISTGTLRETTSLGGGRTVSTRANALTVKYYNINGSTGFIMESTVAANATMITYQLQVTGLTGSNKTYNFFTGALLRNHQ